MIRIMVWNIERFGNSKLQPSAWDAANSRRTYIHNLIQQVDPDVLIVVEVQTAWTGFGDLISGGSGPPGVLGLWNWLTVQTPLAEWSLVPPAILTPLGGYSEGIAVFFKANKLSFEGPMIWDGATIRAHGAAPPAAYPAPWTTTLPAGMSHTWGAIPQRQLAGQYEFAAGGYRLDFGRPNGRSIWQTRLWDTAANRYLNIYSLHVPPRLPDAAGALGVLARIAPLRVNPIAEEDRVIAGDFNLNSNSENGRLFEQFTDSEQKIAGAPKVPIKYQLVIGASNTRTTNVTRVLRADTTGIGPLFGYSNRNAAGQPKAIDNALVIRGGGRARAKKLRVVNRIHPPPVEMASSIPVINATLVPGAPRKRRFNRLVNFGHIGGGRGASDHLPFVFELP